MVEGKKRTIFAVLNHEAGRGPTRLRRLVWDRRSQVCRPTSDRSQYERFPSARAACFQAHSKQKQPQAAGSSGFVESLPGS